MLHDAYQRKLRAGTSLAEYLGMSVQSHELALRPSNAMSATAALSAGATGATPRERDNIDPIHRVRAARARLMNRLHELERRVKQTKDVVNLASHIRAQPLVAVGVGLALGATVGFMRRSRAPSVRASTLLAQVRSVAMDGAKKQLRGWTSRQLRRLMQQRSDH